MGRVVDGEVGQVLADLPGDLGGQLAGALELRPQAPAGAQVDALQLGAQAFLPESGALVLGYGLSSLHGEQSRSNPPHLTGPLSADQGAGHPRSVEPMQHGASRTEVVYAWPRLSKPQPRVPIAYLDLNHWIGLAKAAVDHPDGRKSAPALEALRELRAAGEVCLPLSSTHYMEMTRIGSSRQRFDVGAVMEELSDFACLMNRTILIRLELDAAIRAVLGSEEWLYAGLPLIGRGGMQAMGMRGDLVVRDGDGNDVTAQARREFRDGPAAFDRWRRDAEDRLSRSFLRGPSNEEEPALRAEGWDPEKATALGHKRAEQENEHAARLAADPRWRRGRLRDVVAGRYLALEVFDDLNDCLGRWGVDLSEICSDPESARRFSDSMPGADVWITMLTAMHRNPQTRWSANDIYDVDALCAAVPYCDLVATERHAAHLLHVAGLPERIGTTVVASLDEAVEEMVSLVRLRSTSAAA